MSAVVANLKDETNNKFVNVVRCGPEISSILSSAGVDPSELNCIRTPLMGANRYATCKLLVAFPAPSNTYGTLPYLAPGSELSDIRWTLFLFEPFARFQAEKPIPPNIGSKPPPNLGGDTVPDSGDAPVAARAGIPGLGFESPFSRYMQWKNLLCLSMQEILLSAGAQQQVISTLPRNVSQSALYVMEFVDCRYFLSKQMLMDIDVFMGDEFDGYAWDQWNMTADNPLHLTEATVKTHEVIRPNYDDPTIPNDPGGRWGIPAAAFKGMAAPSNWYNQTAFSASDILNSIVTAYNKLKTPFDRDRVTIDLKDDTGKDVSASYSPKSKYDMIDLDLRSRTLGQALDDIAARIGCVWIWDRRLSRLVLTEANPKANRLDVKLAAWRKSNEQYRTVGGLNELSLNMPEYVYTVHPARYVTTYGNTISPKSRVLQDWRTFRASDGVTSPSAAWIGPDSPMYYINGDITGITRQTMDARRTAFISDHLPAFFGITTEEAMNWADYIPASETSGIMDYPWNYDQTSGDVGYWNVSAWSKKSYAETLLDRNQTLSLRYTRLRSVISGDLRLARIPDSGYLTPMDMTPSVGLHWDEVHFGSTFTDQVRYHIWGDKDDSLLLPYLIEQPRLYASGLARVHKQSGGLNLQVLRPRDAIARTFLAAVEPVSILAKRGTSDRPVMWLYRLQEVFLASAEFPKFMPGNEWGSIQDGEYQYCMNLAEARLLSSYASNNTTGVPTTSFDGGILRYDAGAGATGITLTPIKGVCPVYEVISESGARFFWFCQQNGYEVTCGTSTAAATNYNWTKSGASGVGFAEKSALSDIIQMP